MWDRAKIHALLDSKPAAVTRALLAIYEYQTATEKSVQHTRDANGVGFSAFDAPFLSDIAEKVKQGRSLSPKQFAIVKNKMKRYHRQLVAIANAKEQAQPSVAVAVEASSEPYQRLKPAGCDCENYDGERLCDWCLDPENAEARLVMIETRDIQRAEREEAQRVAAFKMQRDARLRAGDHW